jgi:hypothetical protein
MVIVFPGSLNESDIYLSRISNSAWLLKCLVKSNTTYSLAKNWHTQNIRQISGRKGKISHLVKALQTK